jgi:acyl-CoA synthetase (AMP-forming)/AMP-acid ligase II
VLLLMLDGSDWPVSFLGSLYAGVVPVAVNTLLTVDDYAYMLGHSRARAAIVSGALLPTLRQAMSKAAHVIARTAVIRPAGDIGDALAFDALKAGGRHRRCAGLRCAARRGARAARRCDARRRRGVLAVLVGIDGRAERSAARPFEPARDGRDIRNASARHRA